MIKTNRRKIVAAIVLAAVCQTSSAQSDPLYELIQAVAPETVQSAARTETGRRHRQDNSLILQIAERWKRSPLQVQRIVEYAKAHAHPDFPRLPHLLAIMAVESRFDTKAKSRGNVGLMQINLSANGGRLRLSAQEQGQTLR